MVLAAAATMPAMRYPPARRLDRVERLHGFEIADPYRWLEDPGSEETEAWSRAQDELLAGWMDGRPGREAARRRLERLLGAGLVSVPVLRGGRKGLAQHQDHGIPEGDQLGRHGAARAPF